MTSRIGSAAGTSIPRAPIHVRLFAPLAEWLMGAGVPLGPNGLITIRGRTSGRPHTMGVAIIRVSGRRWIWAPWGEMGWVKNLRAAGRATLTVRGRKEEVIATELDQTERVAYFRDVLGPTARSIPGGVSFIRMMDGVDVRDPEKAAEGRYVFELKPLTEG